MSNGPINGLFYYIETRNNHELVGTVIYQPNSDPDWVKVEDVRWIVNKKDRGPNDGGAGNQGSYGVNNPAEYTKLDGPVNLPIESCELFYIQDIADWP